MARLAVMNWSSLLHSQWVWLAVLALLAAAAMGFIAGHLSARWRNNRAEARARTGVKRLFETVLRSLDVAAEVSTLFDHHEGRSLSPSQVEHLDRRRASLQFLLTHIVEKQHPADSTAADETGSETAEKPRRLEPLKTSWTRAPMNPVSELPDQPAFDASLAMLLEAGKKSSRTSHLLIIKIDRLPSLTSRLGRAGGHVLTRKVASLICRTVRDEDLVCHIGSDTLAVLLPGTDHATGDRLARSIRDAVRAHNFRVDPLGPEVLVTASFGLSVCLPEDSPDLVLDRAAHALAKSQRLGRNQLHVHDGIGLIHCALSA